MLEASFCLLRNLDREAGRPAKDVLSPSCGRRRVSFRSHLFLRPSSTSWQPSWIKVFIRFMKGSENHSLASLCTGGLPLAGERKAGPRRSTEFLLALRRSPAHVGRSCLFCVFGIKYSVACISPPQICIRQIQTLSKKKKRGGGWLEHTSLKSAFKF